MKKHVQVGAMKDCYIIAGRGMFFLKECTSEGYERLSYGWRKKAGVFENNGSEGYRASV
jgi:hypothetical protein